MVTLKMLRKTAVSAGLMVTAVLGILYFIPSLSDHPVPAQQVILRHAMDVFRQRFGKAPDRLVDLTDILEEITNTRCSITPISESLYRVWINLGGARTDVCEVEYAVARNAKSEVFHVRNIRAVHHN